MDCAFGEVGPAAFQHGDAVGIDDRGDFGRRTLQQLQQEGRNLRPAAEARPEDEGGDLAAGEEVEHVVHAAAFAHHDGGEMGGVGGDGLLAGEHGHGPSPGARGGRSREARGARRRRSAGEDRAMAAAVFVRVGRRARQDSAP